MRPLFIWLFIIPSFSAYNQDKTVDSLLLHLSSGTDQVKMAALRSLFNYYRESNHDSAM
jgi:hypothetical protein